MQGPHGLDGAVLNSLTSNKGISKSKWSVNISEIVKRTQKNLERGSSSSKINLEKQVGVSTDPEVQHLSKQTKLGFGSLSTKDKNSLLYYDLKKKLSYESGPQTASNELVGTGTRVRKEGTFGFVGQNSAKNERTHSVSQPTHHYMANQKAFSGVKVLSDQASFVKHQKRCAFEEPYHHEQQVQSMNDMSGTTSSMQGTQGGGEIYSDTNVQANSASRSIQERSLAHQRTLMQAGRLNLIGAEDPDEEA